MKQWIISSITKHDQKVSISTQLKSGEVKLSLILWYDTSGKICCEQILYQHYIFILWIIQKPRVFTKLHASRIFSCQMKSATAQATTFPHCAHSLGQEEKWQWKGFKFTVIESTSKVAQTKCQYLTWFKLNQLICLAGGFNALQSRIFCKIYSDYLKHALSTWEGLVERVCSFIQNPLST